MKKLPKVLQLEITTKCNLNCIFCKNNSHMVQNRGEFSIENFKKLFIKNDINWDRINLWGTGEPFMHSDFFQFVEISKKQNIPRIKVSTNGHFLTDTVIEKILNSGITDIRIALDSINKIEYQNMRKNASFKKVINGIRKLSSIKLKTKSTIKIIVCSVISKENLHQVEDIKNFVMNLGADEYEPIVNIWSKDFKIENLENGKDRCSQQLETFNILADGNVVPCCYVYDNKIYNGNVFYDNIEEIWFGKESCRNRTNFLSNNFTSCNKCNYGVKLGDF